MVRLRTCLSVLSLTTLAGAFACGAPTMAGGDVPTGDAGADDVRTKDDTIGVYPEAGSPVPEASFPDTGAECSPVNLASFTPLYSLPVGPYTGACSDPQIQDAVDRCVAATRDPATCAAWVSDPKNAGCFSCLAGPVDGMTLAPILVSAGTKVFRVNEAGCVALADPAELPCAQALEYEVECDVAACAAACPVAPTGNLDALNTCTSLADMGGCASYYAEAQKCEGALAGSGSPASYCTGVATRARPALERYFTMACGSPGAGSDGGSPEAGGAEGGYDAGYPDAGYSPDAAYGD